MPTRWTMRRSEISARAIGILTNAFGSFVTTNTVVSRNEACATGSQSGDHLHPEQFVVRPQRRRERELERGWLMVPPAERLPDFLNGLNDGNGDDAIGVGFALETLAVGASAEVSSGSGFDTGKPKLPSEPSVDTGLIRILVGALASL